jgi:predicted transcriptional regulator
VDDTQIGLLGLDEVMAELYAEGREANDGTVEEFIKRLEAKKNYIPASERARRDYAYVLLREYKKYLKERNESL